jgi:hypothetical protein
MNRDSRGKVHSDRDIQEHRNDKFGQNVRLKCKCGIVTNWHTDLWKAQFAMYEEHVYQSNKNALL